MNALQRSQDDAKTLRINSDVGDEKARENIPTMFADFLSSALKEFVCRHCRPGISAAMVVIVSCKVNCNHQLATLDGIRLVLRLGTRNYSRHGNARARWSLGSFYMSAQRLCQLCI